MDGASSSTQTRETNRFIFIVEKPRKNVNTGSTERNFDVEEAFSYRMTGKDKREVKKIIFEHFEYIESEWDEFQEKK